MSGKPPRTKPAPATNAPEQPKKTEGLDGRLYTGLAVLVAALAGLVWWSLPNEHAPPAVVIEVEAGVVADLGEHEGGAPRSTVERAPRASAELSILTAKPEDEVRRLATTEEIAKHLEARHCGAACGAVKRALADDDSFSLEVVTIDSVVLPPKDTFDTVAIGLTPSERDSIDDRKTAVGIHLEGNTTPEQIPARALLSIATVLAEMLDGFVYDDIARRIFSKKEILGQAITVPLGEPVFKPQQIGVQLYRQEDGTERMISLGMARFGAPDLTIRGASMSAGPLLSNVLNAAAAQIVAGKNDAPITITLADVAKVVGKTPADLSADPGAARPVTLDVLDPESVDGNPENEIAELAPPGGPSREGWDLVVSMLFGAPASTDDKKLGVVAKKSRSTLPDAIKRFQGGEGGFFVRGPFPIPADARVDGGAATELLWIEVVSCDASLCTGVLTNEPTYASNIAPGKTTSVKRDEAVDWLIQQRDGGTAGGESIPLQHARAQK